MGTAEPYSGRSFVSNRSRISAGSEPANTYDATSPWCWMWLRTRPSRPSIRPMSWNSSNAISAR